MDKPLSRRVVSMAGSATVQAMDKVRSLRQRGIDIMDLSGGDPDFDTPEHIRRAAWDSMSGGFTHYVASKGIPELRTAIAKKLATENGVEIDPNEGIIVTPGGKLALYATLMAVVDDADEVILPEPAWVSYRPIIELAGGKVISLELSPENGYALTADAIRSLITPRTKAVLFNSPCNPTGKVMGRQELECIAAVACEHNLYVIADEMYEKILFDGHKHISIASLPGMADRTVIINGLSKTYAMTGWRLGYLAGPTRLVRQVGKIQEQTATCAPSFVQSAAVAALTDSQDQVVDMGREYQRRRDFFVPMLNDIPRVKCFVPEGAFYAFPKFDLGMNSVEIADLLLDQARVAGTPGSAFGDIGDGHLRFSFATSPAVLEAAALRIEVVLSRLA